jgi:hypothetical protein
VTAGVLLWRAEGGGALVASPALDTHVDLRVTGLVARATVLVLADRVPAGADGG